MLRITARALSCAFLSKLAHAFESTTILLSGRAALAIIAFDATQISVTSPQSSTSSKPHFFSRSASSSEPKEDFFITISLSSTQDYQADFVNGALGFAGAELLEPIISDKIAKCRSDGGQVGFFITISLSSTHSAILPYSICPAVPSTQCITRKLGKEF